MKSMVLLTMFLGCAVALAQQPVEVETSRITTFCFRTIRLKFSS